MALFSVVCCSIQAHNSVSILCALSSQYGHIGDGSSTDRGSGRQRGMLDMQAGLYTRITILGRELTQSLTTRQTNPPKPGFVSYVLQ